MADERDDDDGRPELIEQKMQSTRESLTEKVAALESQVVGTISEATSTVQDTIQSVKEAMSDTVGTVKSTVADVKETVSGSVDDVTAKVKGLFDVSAHTRENPVAMIGGAAAVGFVTGYLLFRDRGIYAAGPDGGSPSMPAAAHPSYAASSSYNAPRASYAPTPESSAAEPRQPGWFARMTGPLLDRAGQELMRIGEQALTQAATQLEQTLQTQVPKLIDGAVGSAAGLLHKDDTAATGPSTHGKPNGAGVSGRPGAF